MIVVRLRLEPEGAEGQLESMAVGNTLMVPLLTWRRKPP